MYTVINRGPQTFTTEITNSSDLNTIDACMTIFEKIIRKINKKKLKMLSKLIVIVIIQLKSYVTDQKT